MFGWHALFVTVNGIGQALIAAGTLAAVHKAITGTRCPISRPPQDW